MTMMESFLLSRQREIDVDKNSIEYGLDVVLSHLEKPLDRFPWRIMTFLTVKQERYQVQVNNREEAIALFKQSNLLDCRISAYPFPVPELNGINGQIPNFFLSDLDRKNFKTDKLLKQALQRTLQNFDSKLKGAKPTVIFTGGGYHLLQPLDADIVLETLDIFKEFIRFEPSRRLMQYAEMLITDGKADPVHNNTVAFSNCMIRIPNSYNSKYVQKDSNGEIILTPQSRVRIEQLSNGIISKEDPRWYKPNIRYLLEGLWESLIQERNNEISKGFLDEKKRILFEIKHPYDVSPPKPHYPNRIDWIERLLENPLGDFRKYCITFFLVPYFINVKTLSDLDSLDRTETWLEKCRSVQRLNFNVKPRVKYGIKIIRAIQRTGHFIKPKPLHKLKVEIPELYALLQKQRVIVH
ncbi:MAG: hypothetical protein WCC17_10855 [Candidatus Nitrosopolaris sp.]